MKHQSLLRLAITASLGAAIAVPLASAAPLNPKKSAKSTQKKKKSGTSSSGNASQQAFGGRVRGSFKGTLRFISARANGEFDIKVGDPANGKNIVLRGCSMRLADVPFLGDWVGRQERINVWVGKDCIDNITVW